MPKKKRSAYLLGSAPVYYIRSLADFPNPPINGWIFLDALTSYIIIGLVDLHGNRLFCKGIVDMGGVSSETSYLVSTGLTSGAMITSAYSLPIKNLTIYGVSGAAYVFDLNGGGTAALDWSAFNMLDCRIGTVANVTNYIIGKSFFGGCYGFVFDGSISTISVDFSLFTVAAGQTLMTLSATLTIAARFRLMFSRFLSPAGATVVNVAAGAAVPTDMFILTGCGFAGAGSYVTGITAFDNRADFTSNKGLVNTGANAFVYMTGNATPTVITAIGAFVKVAGDSVAGIMQRFDMPANNRVRSNSEISRIYKIDYNLGAEAGNNQIISVRLHRYNSSGVLLATSPAQDFTATGNLQAGRVESAAISWHTQLDFGDYIEPYVANKSAIQSILVPSNVHSFTPIT